MIDYNNIEIGDVVSLKNRSPNYLFSVCRKIPFNKLYVYNLSAYSDEHTFLIDYRDIVDI